MDGDNSGKQMQRLKNQNKLHKPALRLDPIGPKQVVPLDGPLTTTEIRCPKCGRSRVRKRSLSKPQITYRTLVAF